MPPKSQAVQHRGPCAFGNHGFRLGMALAVNVQQRIQLHQVVELFMIFKYNKINKLEFLEEILGMEHDINLNIHYTAPKEVWEKIDTVYSSMPYWAGDKNGPRWMGKEIDLWASVEPSGIQIAGTMPNDIWEEWYALLKKRLTEVLGYEIGEPEEGYDFKYFG